MSRSKNSRQNPRSPKRTGAPRPEGISAATEVLRGVQFLQQNKTDSAKECFERAMLADPRDAVARNCLGIIARVENRTMEAVALFHKAIDLQPEFAEAHNNLGNALRDTGSLLRAADCYRKALTLKPAFPEAHNNLGVVLLAQGEVDSAIACFEEAIRLHSNYAEAHNNLANAYREQGELIAAAASLQTALLVKPGSAEIHNNLANVLRETGQTELAIEHYQQAVSLKPELGEAQDNLGTALVDLDRPGEAIEAYERAQQLQPTSIATLLNLGNAYQLVGRVTDARRIYQQVAIREPEEFWHRVRLAALCPSAFHSHRELEDHRRRAMESWSLLAEERKGLDAPALNCRLAEPAFAWQFLDGNLRSLKELFASIFGVGWPMRDAKALSPRPRVGIVVTRGHEGLFLRSLNGVLQRLHPSHFEIAVVCPSSSETLIRNGLQRPVDFVVMPPDFRLAAEAIRAAQFAVLYFWEVGTDATNYFLPFLQLAPVQCTSWGVQVTSGNRHLDYYLSSTLVEPNNAQEHYAEQLLLSPTLLSYQTPPQLPAQCKDRSAFGFRQQDRIYVCAQQLGKFHPDFDGLIGGVLRQDGDARFVVVSDKYGHTTQIVRNRFAETLPDVHHRIVFLPRLLFPDYLQLLNVADVLLDPPHFGGVNSTYDALAVGQPIITLPSEFHRGRYTAACLKQIGVTETIACDAEDYIRLAVNLAQDRHKLADLRHRIRTESQRLFHNDASVQEHERLFGLLIDQACNR